MPFVTRRSLLVLGLFAAAGAAAIAGVAWSGLYDVGADTAHSRPVFALLETVRERSIAVRAARLTAPADLADAERVRHGAGNYEHMCESCHGAPGGRGDQELIRGLYPAPPDLTRETVDPRMAFWTIKHGIKGSGMAAWGKGMDDKSMWNLVAFLQQLPRLDAAGYDALVAASGGHSHEGGSAIADGQGADHHAPGAAPAHADEHAHDAPAAAPPAPATTTHLHADGKTHLHAAEPAPAPPAPEPADNDEHDHDAHDH
jgi:mono/diheme cytochrome c family protein